MKRATSLSLLLFFVLAVTARRVEGRVRDYQTTRLKSTAGAGVGSILINESAILNPAPLAFYKNSSFYFQRGNLKATGEEGGERAKESDNLGIIVADTKKNLRGAISYQKQSEGAFKRRRMTLSLASIMGPSSSLGFLYRNTKDEVTGQRDQGQAQAEGSGEEGADKYHQLVVGATHVISEHLTFGTVVVDPFRTKEHDTQLVFGGQYTLKNILTFIVDVGTHYNDDLLSTRLFRGAIQLNFIKSLFFRMGFFEDLGADERGTGIGIAWVGPRLVLEASMKTTRDIGAIENEFNGRDNGQYGELRETSFALSYFF